MTELEDISGSLSDSAMWARAIGCSVSSIEAWWKDREDADIPPDEMALIRKFTYTLFSCNCCGNLALSSTSVPNPSTRRELRR